MRVFKDGASQVPEMSLAADSNQISAAQGLAGIKCILAIASARGGTGKSAIAVNLAVSLTHLGVKVGILDADVNSSSILPMLGMKPARRPPFSEWIEPAAGPSGLRVVASDLVPDRQSIPPNFAEVETVAGLESNGHPPVEISYSEALASLLYRTRFGGLDLLLVDLACGLESFARFNQLAPRAGLIVVAHPSEQCARATAGMLEFAASRGVAAYGIIENMVGFHCDRCHSVRPLMHQGGITAVARAARVPIIERFPFDPRFAETTDRGAIFVREYQDIPLTKQFVAIAQTIKRSLSAIAAAQAASAGSDVQSVSSSVAPTG
jgi:ATP-binding protein involved in chromosome partitioning